MNIESIIAILANFVAILVAAKNDTTIFSFLKKNFFNFFCPAPVKFHLAGLQDAKSPDPES